MNYPACDYCGANDKSIKFDFGEYKLTSCKKCGLFYLFPRPDGIELERLYSSSYFKENIRDTNWGENNEDQERLIKEKAFLLDYVETYYKSGVLLEIGCATGYFIEHALRAGFNVKGIEISNYAAKQAKQLTGAPVFSGTIEQALAAQFVFPNELDVIVMSHILEHVDSPRSTLKIIFDLLNKNGIAIIRVPDIGGFDAKLHGINWEGLSIPYHFYHFTPSTLKRYITDAGFNVIEFDYWIHGSIAKPLLLLRNSIRKLLSCFSANDNPKLKDNDLKAAIISKHAANKKNIIKRLGYPFRGRSMTFVIQKP